VGCALVSPYKMLRSDCGELAFHALR
jgi:hypothetical protein